MGQMGLLPNMDGDGDASDEDDDDDFEGDDGGESGGQFVNQCTKIYAPTPFE